MPERFDHPAKWKSNELPAEPDPSRRVVLGAISYNADRYSLITEKLTAKRSVNAVCSAIRRIPSAAAMETRMARARRQANFFSIPPEHGTDEDAPLSQATSHLANALATGT